MTNLEDLQTRWGKHSQNPETVTASTSGGIKTQQISQIFTPQFFSSPEWTHSSQWPKKTTRIIGTYASIGRPSLAQTLTLKYLTRWFEYTLDVVKHWKYRDAWLSSGLALDGRDLIVPRHGHLNTLWNDGPPFSLFVTELTGIARRCLKVWFEMNAIKIHYQG